jgi:hypothetical protein
MVASRNVSNDHKCWQKQVTTKRHYFEGKCREGLLSAAGFKIWVLSCKFLKLSCNFLIMSQFHFHKKLHLKHNFDICFICELLFCPKTLHKLN